MVLIFILRLQIWPWCCGLGTEEWYLVCLHKHHCCREAETGGQRGLPAQSMGCICTDISQKHIAVSGKREHVPTVYRQEEGTVGRCGIRQMAKLLFQEG